MEIESLLAYRPADDSTAAITAAIAKIGEAIADAEAAADALKTLRPKVLMQGGPVAVRELQTQLTDKGLELEWLTQFQDALRAQLEEAKTEERVRHMAQLAETAEAKAAEADAWMRDSYPQLAAQIRTGIELEAAARRAARLWVAENSANADIQDKVKIPRNCWTMKVHAPQAPIKALCETVRLPFVGPADAKGGPHFWWAD